MLSSRPLRWYDIFTINGYYLGLSALSQTITPLVAPLLVQQFVGEQRQATAYGAIRLWTLMMALLMQALMGLLSDRSTLPLGRRRPFILIGTLGSIVLVLAIGATAGMQGDAGYWTLFGLMMLMMIANNTSHGALQGLIPDLVPEQRRGVYSSIKAMLEVPIPIILTSLTIARLISKGSLWGGLLVLVGLLLASMALTMLAPERRFSGPVPPLDMAPLLRLVLMTAVFTLIILGLGQAVNWLGSALAGAGGSAGALLGMGLAGFGAMAAAVAIGVYASTRLALGSEASRQPAFTWWVANRLAFLVGSTNIISFALYFLQNRLGLERSQATSAVANLFMALGGLILLIAPLSGWLTDRIGRRPVIAASGLIAAIGTLILTLSGTLTGVYIGGGLIGAAAGAFYTANWALGAELVPPREAGRYLGISNLAGAGAGAIGAYIGGPIADHFTTYAPNQPGIGYALLFAIYAALFILSVVLLNWVRPRPTAAGDSAPQTI